MMGRIIGSRTRRFSSRWPVVLCEEFAAECDEQAKEMALDIWFQWYYAGFVRMPL